MSEPGPAPPRTGPAASNTGAGAVKRPGVLVKATVVASSLLLVAGFVGCRSGALSWVIGPSAPSADSGSSLTPAEARSDGATQRTPTVMSGSKSFTPTRFIEGL